MIIIWIFMKGWSNFKVWTVYRILNFGEYKEGLALSPKKGRGLPNTWKGMNFHFKVTLSSTEGKRLATTIVYPGKKWATVIFWLWGIIVSWQHIKFHCFLLNWSTLYQILMLCHLATYTYEVWRDLVEMGSLWLSESSFKAKVKPNLLKELKCISVGNVGSHSETTAWL
jgi:hypothetical protein